MSRGASRREGLCFGYAPCGDGCPDINLPDSLDLKTGPRPDTAATPVPNPPDEDANYLVDGDFEQALVFAGGLPNNSGYWAFDQAWSADSGQQGISPVSSDSDRMLHFVSSSATGTQNGTASEQTQLVDVSSLSEDIALGLVQVEASVHFNRVSAGGCGNIDTAFGIRVSAFGGLMADFLNSTSRVELGAEATGVLSDDDPSTWEQGTAVLTLPTNMTFVAVWIYVDKNTCNDAEYPEFHGHYADNASLTVRLMP
jgi:hypothetical protein